MARNVDITIDVHSSAAEADVRSLAEQTDDLGDTAERAGKKAEISFGGIGETASVALGNVAAAAVEQVTQQVGMLATQAVQTGIDFEAGMQRVGALSQSTQAQLEEQTQSARELGATTSFSASEAAQGMQYLARTGYDVNQQLGAMPGLLDAAAAGQTELGQTADVVSNVLKGFQMEASETGRAADVLTATFTTSNTDLRSLGETMKYVAPIAGSLGLELEEVAAAAGAMGNRGIQGSEAGTALRATIGRLLDPSKEAADRLERLGVTVTKSSGEMRSLSGIIGEVEEATAGMTKAQRQAALSQVVGQEAVSGFTALLASGSKGLADYTERLRASGGVAEQVAERQLDTLRGDLEELGGAWDEVSVAAYDAFDEELRGSTQEMTELVRGLAEGVVEVEDFFDEWGSTLANVGRVAGVAAAGIGGFKAATLLLNPAIATVITRLTVASRAARMYSASTGAAALGTRGFTAAFQAMKGAIASNPVGALVTVISSAAAAFYLFTQRTDEATEELREQREEAQNVIDKLEELKAQQVGQKLFEVNLDLSNAESKLQKTKDKIAALKAEGEYVAGTYTTGRGGGTITEYTAEGNRLRNQRIQLQKTIRTQREAKAQLEERITETLTGQIALKREQLRKARDQTKLTEAQQKRMAELRKEEQEIRDSKTLTNEQVQAQLDEIEKKRAAIQEKATAQLPKARIETLQNELDSLLATKEAREEIGQEEEESPAPLGQRIASLESELETMRRQGAAQEKILAKEKELKRLRAQQSPGGDPDDQLKAYEKVAAKLREINNLRGDNRIGEQEATKRRIEALRKGLDDLSAAGEGSSEAFAKLRQRLRDIAQAQSPDLKRLAPQEAVGEIEAADIETPAAPDLSETQQALGETQRKITEIRRLQKGGLITNQESAKRRVRALRSGLGKLVRAGKGSTKQAKAMRKQLKAAKKEAQGDWGAQALQAFQQKAAQMGRSIRQIFSAMHKRRMKQIRREKQERLESINAAEERELDSLDRRIEAAEEGSKKRERLAEKRRDLKDKYDDKREKAQEKAQVKQAKAKREQAKMDKAKALFEIGLNTASAVTEALPNVPLSIAVGAIGAAQMAAAAARPLPEVPSFAEGAVRLTREGLVKGPGGPREDRVPATLEGAPIRVSAGESIINAASTAAAPTALEAINAGEREARRVEELAVGGGAPVGSFAEGSVGAAGGDLHESMADLKRRAAEQPEVKPVPPAVRQGAGNGEEVVAAVEGLREEVRRGRQEQKRAVEEQTDRLANVERKVDVGRVDEELHDFRREKAKTRGVER